MCAKLLINLLEDAVQKRSIKVILRNHLLSKQLETQTPQEIILLILRKFS